MKPLNVCLLSHVKPGFPNTCFDHENALSKDSAHNVSVISPLDHPKKVPDFSVFDVIIIHYSIICFSTIYLPPIYRRGLQDFKGLKVIFIQDEYRTVHSAIDAMIELGIDVLFTCVPEHSIDDIYGQLRRRGVKIETTLTGYAPDNLLNLAQVPLHERSLDVTYRGRVLPYALGKLGQEKVYIAKEFQSRAQEFGLKTDIGWREEDRIYGNKWIEFMSSGRAVLGTESGASICDFTGDLDRAVSLYLLEHPDANFGEVFDAFLAPYEGNAIINTISPRAFEAIALGTALVQFPGEYSGVLEANRHYIPLEKDLSNMAEVAEKLRDVNLLVKMTTRAYEEVIASGDHSYQNFSRNVDTIIFQEWERRIYRHPIPFPSNINNHARALSERPASKDELREFVTASLVPDPLDVAQASSGASICDASPFFGRPHDADYLLRPSEEEGYAAVLADAPLPHRVTIDFGQARVIDVVSLLWYDGLHFCKAMKIEACNQLDGNWRTLAEVTSNQQTSQTLTFEPTRARYLRLIGYEFSGQARMLIRRCQVFASFKQIISEHEQVPSVETVVKVEHVEASGSPTIAVQHRSAIPVRIAKRLLTSVRQRR
ncbi:discoidin domain-containing protein [Paraburkholderia sp. GAS334]|uniref:discoidin domain-containing protein n=1 Tax=Paraburkholderia sp. GAS334 TaxID=3035131 RepID=UPI003D21ACB3